MRSHFCASVRSTGYPAVRTQRVKQLKSTNKQCVHTYINSVQPLDLELWGSLLLSLAYSRHPSAHLPLLHNKKWQKHNNRATFWGTFRKMRNIWRNKCICLKVKMRLYEAITTSTLLYSADVWPLTATLMKRLNTNGKVASWAFPGRTE